MNRYTIFFFLLFPVILSAQAQPKTKLSTRAGRVKICLGNNPQNPEYYCWENLEVDMIFNPVNGAFSISVPSKVFKLDTVRYDSIPVMANVALRQSSDFLFSGNAILANPIDLDIYGEYQMRLNGEIKYGDTVSNAALDAILFVSTNGPQIKAEVLFSAQDFNIDFFSKYGIPDDRLKLEMEFQLMRN